jgi:iron(III) transport system substrate-binding protein
VIAERVPHQRISRRSFAAMATVGLAASLLAACGSSSSSTKPSAGSITVYSGQHEQTTQSLVHAFEAKTGISVSVRYNDEDTFADEIVAERSHPVADVFYTENSPVLQYLQEKGMLAKVDASTLARTPSKYNSPQGDWIGVSARVSVIIYNPKLISKAQLPTTVLGLADPKYKGKVALANAESDFQPVVTAVAKAYGQTKALTWLEALKSNAGANHTYPDNETVADEVNRGAVAFGVVNQYYWYRMQAELGSSQIHSAITYFAPRNPGYVLNVSGAAVLKSSKHQADAEKFLAFLVSKAGQEVIANSGDKAGQSVSFEYPLDDGVTTKAPETPFAQLQPYPITTAELGDGSMAIALLRKAGIL